MEKVIIIGKGNPMNYRELIRLMVDYENDKSMKTLRPLEEFLDIMGLEYSLFINQDERMSIYQKELS